jgi:hypothetical protein
MQASLRWLLVCSTVVFASSACAQHSICGPAPVFEARAEETESLQRELRGEAEGLRRSFGGTDFPERVVRTRTRLFQSADKIRAAQRDAYLTYIFCVLIIDDRSIPTAGKLKAIQTFQMASPEAAERAKERCAGIGRRNGLAGLRIMPEYGTSRNELQAGRSMRRLLTDLNATAVSPGEDADLSVSVGTRIATSETIGSRHAEASLTLTWRVAGSEIACAAAPMLSSGSGVGPTFEAATERAIEIAIMGLQRQMSGSF